MSPSNGGIVIRLRRPLHARVTTGNCQELLPLSSMGMLSNPARACGTGDLTGCSISGSVAQEAADHMCHERDDLALRSSSFDDLNPDKLLELWIRVKRVEVGISASVPAMDLAHSDRLAEHSEGFLDLPTSGIGRRQGIHGMISAGVELERLLKIRNGRGNLPPVQLDDTPIIKSLGCARHRARCSELLLTNRQISPGTRKYFSLFRKPFDQGVKCLARSFEILAVEESNGLFKSLHHRRSRYPLDTGRRGLTRPRGLPCRGNVLRGPVVCRPRFPLGLHPTPS